MKSATKAQKATAPSAFGYVLRRTGGTNLSSFLCSRVAAQLERWGCPIIYSLVAPEFSRRHFSGSEVFGLSRNEIRKILEKKTEKHSSLRSTLIRFENLMTQLVWILRQTLTTWATGFSNRKRSGSFCVDRGTAQQADVFTFRIENGTT